MVRSTTVSFSVDGGTLINHDADEYRFLALVFFFLAGFVTPLIGWLANKKWPNSWLRYVK